MSEEIKITVIATGFVSLEEKAKRAEQVRYEEEIKPVIATVQPQEEVKVEPVVEEPVAPVVEEVKPVETAPQVEEQEEPVKRKLPKFMERLFKKNN